jgi:methyl-accepting chemotaxis protein
MVELNSTINELTHSSRAVAGLAEQAATSVNDVSDAMAKLDTSVQATSAEVRKSTSLSEEATERIASKGIAAVGNAIDTMGRIESFFTSLSGTITGLDARSNDIANIVNAIHEVSDQVNLLSLNAMIIAAQAGENGKGFSVVAKEMKQLAMRAGRSAKEIEEIIESIQQDIHAAVSESEETARAVEEGKTVAVITGEVIDEILTISSRSTEMAQEIANSACLQNRLIEEVQKDVAKLRGLNEKVKHATVEEEQSAGFILEAASRISGSLGETRRQAEEQFLSLKAIAENTGDTNRQLEEIAQQSTRQQEINGEIVDSIGGNVVMAEAMVTAVQKVSKEIGSVFHELERLRGEVGMFRT